MSDTIANSLIVVAALAIIIAAAAALWVVGRMLTRGKPRTVRLELSNQGNVSGRYELKAEEASGQVRFQFFANATPLTTTVVAREGDVVPQWTPPQAARGRWRLSPPTGLWQRDRYCSEGCGAASYTKR